MSSKVDKLKLGEFDRRKKLTQEQKQEIYNKYHSDMGYSLNKLAKEYNVSKKSILLIVNTEIKKKNDEQIKNNWDKYKISKEENCKRRRELREYKKQLIEKGLLKIE